MLAVAIAARTMDVTSLDELRVKAQQNGPQAAEAFREWMLPLGTWVKVTLSQALLEQIYIFVTVAKSVRVLQKGIDASLFVRNTKRLKVSTFLPFKMNAMLAITKIHLVTSGVRRAMPYPVHIPEDSINKADKCIGKPPVGFRYRRHTAQCIYCCHDQI